MTQEQRSAQLLEQVKVVDALIAQGMTPFQAMSAVFNDDDWLIALIGFKTMVGRARRMNSQRSLENAD